MNFTKIITMLCLCLGIFISGQLAESNFAEAADYWVASGGTTNYYIDSDHISHVKGGEMSVLVKIVPTVTPDTPKKYSHSSSTSYHFNWDEGVCWYSCREMVGNSQNVNNDPIAKAVIIKAYDLKYGQYPPYVQ